MTEPSVDGSEPAGEEVVELTARMRFEGGRLSGTVSRDGAPARAFEGWIELVASVEEAAGGEQGQRPDSA